MIQLSDEQLNQLGKEALVVIVSSLQDQLLALQSQLDQANAQLSDNNRADRAAHRTDPHHESAVLWPKIGSSRF